MSIAELRRYMDERGLDAIIAASPENFYYSTGYPSFILYTGRVAGLALAVIPRSEKVEPSVIINEFEVDNFVKQSSVRDVTAYPMWVHIEDLCQLSSPKELANLKPLPPKGESIDLAGNFDKLASALKKTGLDKGEIGIEYFFFQQVSWSLLTACLPEAQFADATDVFYRARSIKSPQEVDYLRLATRAAEAGISASAAEIRKGVTEEHLATTYRATVARQHGTRGSRHCIISLGQEFAPSYIPRKNPALPGDLVKYDVGADCCGYGSDIGRTFIVGRPTGLQETIYAALKAGHDAALGVVRPDVQMSEVFRVGQDTVRANGIPNYTLGHIGHSVGLDERIEEPPYLSPHEERLLSPGMVLCVEMPYYAYGVGAFQLEDMVLVTDSGHERLTTLSRELVCIE
ncbi:MAG: M24 family metallopeptidase [Candidatus Lindowbacteria bacterium]|nr:M24 family metallopeptidase [Candidatus Lindowbacteria bacterium]